MHGARALTLLSPPPHVACLRTAGTLKVGDMMHAVREFLHADAHMAYHLWTLMFPIVWATLEKQQQVRRRGAALRGQLPGSRAHRQGPPRIESWCYS